jgi:hypothetical protein
VSPSGPTIGTASVLTAETTVPLTENVNHIIEANEGVKFNISGQTADTEYTFSVVATLSDTKVKGLDCILKVG